MQAWLCEDPTGVESLRWTDLPDPEPGPGEVRIRVQAASLNFPDLLIVQNKYQVKPPLPFVPGAEYSGIVDHVGAEVHHLKPGDRVAALGSTGGFATVACADARRVLALPDHLPFDQAAAFAFTYGTSHHALMDRGALQPGETVLVLGAAGGVGSAAVQIAKAAGARVIAGASTDEKCAFCREIGADATINYGREDLREALKALTDGRGPDVVYDAVGGDLAEPAFRSIAWRGRYLMVGFAAGGIPSLPLNLPLLKGAAILGVFWGSFTQREPKAFARSIADLLRWQAEGKVQPLIDRRLPMRELPAAYAHMGSRQVRGKVVLVNE
ncbi:NADPH:quinone oxidoreductase family protein [Aquabacterium sp. J223]|uniref:NADPH:quinone oxidoreductase family protein n=1 Tax=Aquabacterium sp. J223 TaxID=2898431 RepID=UPI0021ADC4BF|nr:NADPH:quinone oxidoreductase family protein [Aquabacterium sp. J223]UUX97710.1 NADPH:quinone oxidoreductase family protein [Aquabacterium sp. J223]